MKSARFTIAQASLYLDFPKQTLAHWRYLDRGLLRQGKPRQHGPRWIEVGGRCLGYRKQDLDDWLNDHVTD